MTLTLTDEEADLVLLALQAVIMHADPDTSDSALALEARIVELTPPPSEKPVAGPISTEISDFPELLRQAIRSETMVEIAYTDRKGAATKRRICPILPDDPEAPDMIAAWCERRGDFRQFRLDRIRSIRPTGDAYPRRLRLLRAEWLSVADLDDF